MINQMSSISFISSSCFDILMKQASLSTNSPGISITPLTIHILITTFYSTIHQQLPSFHFSSSSSSSSCTLPCNEQWEIGNSSIGWRELNKVDSSLLSTCIQSELNNCVIRINSDEKYLINLDTMKLMNIHSGYSISFFSK